MCWASWACWLHSPIVPPAGANVAAEGELDSADQLGTSSAVSSANQYVVLAVSPLTIKLSD